ncbi:MAG: peptidylprolyl isomerase [Bryobacteraceae bacterium]
MFDLFRSRTKAVRYLLGALLLLVAVMLVVTLVPGFGVPPAAESQVVAEIGGEALGLLDVQRAVQAQLRAQRLPASMASVYVPQIVDRMINEYALAYQALRMGFQVTDADLATAIQRMLPQLFQDGKFAGREAYAAVLAERNMTIAQFEQVLRKQLLIEKLQTLAEASVIITPRELEDAYRRENDNVRIEYVLVDPGKLLPKIKIDSEQIEKHYQANRANYQVPEKRSFLVLIVDEKKISAEASIPEAELRRAYEKNKDSYRVPERVRVRHILLKTTDVPKEEQPKVRQRAEALLKQIRSGADFAELAKKNSQDPGSAEKGGDLGWIVRGQTVKAFEDTAFTLKPNQISDVITTEYGFHILQVLEKEQAHIRSFEEVRGQLAEELKADLVRDRVQSTADRVRSELVRDPQGAERIASAMGLQLVRVKKVSAEELVPEIGSGQVLQQAVSLLRRNEVTPVLQIDPSRYAVAVVTEVVPAHQADLTEARQKILEELLSQRLRQLAEQTANEVLAKAREFQGDLKKAAQATGWEFKAPAPFARNTAVEGLGPSSYVADAFKLPVGALFGPVNVNERRFICKVVQRIPADLSELPKHREALLERLKQERIQQQMEFLERTVREQLVKDRKLKINQAAINRLQASYSSPQG